MVRLKQPALRVPVYSFMRAILTVCAFGVFDEDVFSFSIDIVDDADNLVTQYLSVDELSAQFAKLEDPIDWITDKELLDAMGRVARSCDAHLSKGQVRTLQERNRQVP